MRIGDYIQAGLNTYDPSPYLQASSDATRSIGNSIAQGIGAVGDVVKDRREKKDAIKTSKELAKAMSVLYPESAGALEPVIQQLEDEEMPLSDRAALGMQIGEFINLGVQKSRDNALLSLEQQRIGLAERGMAIDESRNNIEVDAINKAMEESQALTGFMARPALEQVLRETRAAEARGESPLIDSEKLKLAFLKPADQQMQIAAAAMQGLPKAAPLEFRDIEFTRDGQPAKGTAVFDQRTGQFSLVPIVDPTETSLTGLPEGLAPYAADFEAAGAKYGVDPRVLAAISMHETANGTSSAFKNKNNAMGISDSTGPTAQESVPASIERMARLLGSTESGPYKNASTLSEVGAKYAPIGAGNDPRGLNGYWTKGVAANLAKLGGDPSAPIRIKPGASTAPTARPRTETQQKLDELALQKAEGEAKMTQAAGEANKAKAESAITALKLIRDHPGRWAATGLTSKIPTMPGSDAYDFEQKLEQAKALAGTIGIEAMRGLGAMSEKEFQAAKDSIAALDKGQKTETIEKELDKLIGLFEAKLGAAAATTPGTTAADPAAAARDAERARLKAIQNK